MNNNDRVSRELVNRFSIALDVRSVVSKNNVDCSIISVISISDSVACRYSVINVDTLCSVVPVAVVRCLSSRPCGLFVVCSLLVGCSRVLVFWVSYHISCLAHYLMAHAPLTNIIFGGSIVF